MDQEPDEDLAPAMDSLLSQGPDVTEKPNQDQGVESDRDLDEDGPDPLQSFISSIGSTVGGGIQSDPAADKQDIKAARENQQQVDAATGKQPTMKAMDKGPNTAENRREAGVKQADARQNQQGAQHTVENVAKKLEAAEQKQTSPFLANFAKGTMRDMAVSAAMVAVGFAPALVAGYNAASMTSAIAAATNGRGTFGAQGPSEFGVRDSRDSKGRPSTAFKSSDGPATPTGPAAPPALKPPDIFEILSRGPGFGPNGQMAGADPTVVTLAGANMKEMTERERKAGVENSLGHKDYDAQHRDGEEGEEVHKALDAKGIAPGGPNPQGGPQNMGIMVAEEAAKRKNLPGMHV